MGKKSDNEAFENFRKLVVDVALKKAREHDWCEDMEPILVKDLGLGDLMPPVYKIQTLRSPRRRKWEEVSGYFYRDRDKYDLEDVTELAVSMARKSFAANRSAYFSVAIEPDSNIESIVADLRKKAEPVVTLPKKGVWPEYRVIECCADGSEVVVVAMDDLIAKVRSGDDGKH